LPLPSSVVLHAMRQPESGGVVSAAYSSIAAVSRHPGRRRSAREEKPRIRRARQYG
jgi:hypothetical protein